MPSNSANTQDLVPIDEIRDNTVVLKSGRLLKVLMVDGVNFSLKSEEEQNAITGAYQNFLNSLDFSIQIVVHARKVNIDEYLVGLEKRRLEETSALLQNQIDEYREFVRSFVKDNAVMERAFLVVVPFSGFTLPNTSSGALGGVLSFFGKKKPNETELKKKSDENFSEHVSQLDQRVAQVTAGLEAVGLEVLALENQALIELFYNFYNPETVEKKGIASPSLQA